MFGTGHQKMIVTIPQVPKGFDDGKKDLEEIKVEGGLEHDDALEPEPIKEDPDVSEISEILLSDDVQEEHPRSDEITLVSTDLIDRAADKRRIISSTKNFQLVFEDQAADETPRIVLHFGKIRDNEFRMDYQFPLSLVQAFAISLCSLDL